jgi:hypothetical protein
MNGVPTRYGGGIAILGAAHTAVLKTLDNLVVRWAVNAGAEEILPPPIHAVADLVKFDVYTNFPHLSLVAGPLRTDPPTKPHGGQFTSHQILPAGLGLPIATCFGVYLFLEDRRVTDDLLITLSNRCFRSEEYFDGLRRLLTFQMREIVAVGSYEHTQRHLERFTTKIENLAERLSLNMVKKAASDPFFQKESPRALMQQLSAVKNEFQVHGLAISSVNTHRNYFGERCNITLKNGEPAFTSCVAFGLERWLAVLLDRHGGNAEAALEAIRSVSDHLIST